MVYALHSRNDELKQAEHLLRDALFLSIDFRKRRMVTPEQWSEIRNIFLCGSFAGISGGLSYLVKVREGQKFKWGEFFLHLAISAVAGVIAYHLLHYLSTPVDLAGALCGIAGWMGTRLMRIFEIIFLRRLGVEKEMLDEVNKKDGQPW